VNRYPWWVHAVIVLAVAFGLFYALPNFFGSDPALQVTADARTPAPDAALLDRVRVELTRRGIEPKALGTTPEGALLRFGNPEEQLRAQDYVRAALGPGYTVALNLAPAAPSVFERLGARPMYLGLDLRGGVHFLMEVDTEAAVRSAIERLNDDLRTLLRERRIYYRSIERFADAAGSGIDVVLRDAAQREAAREAIAREHAELVIEPGDAPDRLRARLTETYVREARRLALQQNITTLRNRVNELGVAEPIIQQQGESRIVVQLPGVQDTARAKDVIGATATLEFKLVDEDSVAGGVVPPGSRRYALRDGGEIVLKDRTILTGEHITDAASGFDQQSGGPVVHVSLDGAGASQFARVTGENVGRRLAVVFIENRTETVPGPNGEPTLRTRRVEEVITAPVIRDQLGRRFQITGMASPREARDLALLLRAGSLAAPLSIVEERTVGPSMGRDNIRRGVNSTVLGFALVVAVMVLWYRRYGLIADLAVVANLLLLVAVMSLLQATLTLPGIAGIVLTVGMAVDANVLIAERMREERLTGNTPQASIQTGYAKAFGTILDSNLTTLLVGLVLFAFGTGPVKGFAVTLSIGILTSMFSAVVITRALVNFVERPAARSVRRAAAR
jgi:preprotein translocase subunit SecD